MSNIDEMLAVIGEGDEPELPADFADGVWTRIGEIRERRAAIRSNLLAAAMFVVAVGTGFGVTDNPALAHGVDSGLIGSADYSPAALLRVTS